MGEFLDAFNAGVAERERIDAKISPIELYAADPEGAAAEVIRRRRNLDSHVFDYATEFCVNCGQAHEHILNTFIACFGQPKVTAISHLRAAQRETEIIRGSGNIFKDLNVDWQEPDHATRARLGITDDDVARMRAMHDEPDGAA